MSFFNKIKYSIYTLKEVSSFEEMVDKLLRKVEKNNGIFRLVFFASCNDNKEYIRCKKTIFEKVKDQFGQNMPALSLVGQPPLDSPLILEVHSFDLDRDDSIFYRSIDDIPYVLLENEIGRFMFAGGFQGDLIHMSIEEQTAIVFKQINKLLQKEEFSINEIIRQWNYIEQITDQDNTGNQHYQLFNNERSIFYNKTEWTKGYPAATGIGANIGGVLIEIDVVSFRTSDAYITPIDNKLQIAAHEYSTQVLEDANNQKSTPKFERAKSMTIEDRNMIYISGTAAIRGEESLENVGLEKQLHTTMENISELINNAEVKLLRVYLKHSEDYEEAVKLMNSYNLSIPISYVCADICRKELLLEIEGIAMN